VENCVVKHTTDDFQSQWGMAKFENQPTPNPWTDCHQIWNTSLHRGYLLPKKFGLNQPKGLCPHIREIYTQNLRMFTSFFHFIRAPRNESIGPIFALNRSYDVVMRKEVPFGGEKFNFEI